MLSFVNYLILIMLTYCSAMNHFPLFVNDEEVNVTDIELDEKKDFDAKAEYNYHEGELAKIVVRGVKECYMSQELSLYNGTKIFETKVQQIFYHDHLLYIKLTKQYNGSYFAYTLRYFGCRQLTVRLFFLSSSLSKYSDKPILNVNGLTLAPTSKQEYMYEYYNGESLTILSDTANDDERWECITRRNSKLLPIENQHVAAAARINFTVTLDYANAEILEMRCSVRGFLIAFKFSAFRIIDPFIHGLSLSQTLLAYLESNTNYILKYNNKENLYLNITCSSNSPKCTWDFNRSEVSAEDTPFEYSSNINKYTSRLFMKRITNTDETTIKCTCFRDRNYTFSVVVMNQLRDVPKSQVEAHLNSLNNADSKEIVTRRDQEVTTTDATSSSNKTLIISCSVTFGVILIICAVIVGMKAWTSKARADDNGDTNEYEDVDYAACLSSDASVPQAAPRPRCPLPKGAETQEHVYDIVYETRVQRLWEARRLAHERSERKKELRRLAASVPHLRS